MTRLADLSWPQARDRAAAGAVLAVPLGSTEQHGPHLPLSTDTDVAVALCDRLAELRDDVVVAPPLPYGSSGEHAGFAGTVSIGAEALRHVVVELGRSACETFARLLFVSAHGGNAETVRDAVHQLQAESRDVRFYGPAYAGDAHAGRSETSMQLALDADRVALDRAEAGDTRPIGELLPELRAGGVIAVSANGVLGDPAGASAGEGSLLLDTLAAELADHVGRWAT